MALVLFNLYYASLVFEYSGHLELLVWRELELHKFDQELFRKGVHVRAGRLMASLQMMQCS